MGAVVVVGVSCGAGEAVGKLGKRSSGPWCLLRRGGDCGRGRKRGSGSSSQRGRRLLRCGDDSGRGWNLSGCGGCRRGGGLRLRSGARRVQRAASTGGQDTGNEGYGQHDDPDQQSA